MKALNYKINWFTIASTVFIMLTCGKCAYDLYYAMTPGFPKAAISGVMLFFEIVLLVGILLEQQGKILERILLWAPMGVILTLAVVENYLTEPMMLAIVQGSVSSFLSVCTLYLINLSQR